MSVTRSSGDGCGGLNVTSGRTATKTEPPLVIECDKFVMHLPSVPWCSYMITVPAHERSDCCLSTSFFHFSN